MGNYGLIVCAGDLQNGFSKVGMHAQAKTVAGFLTSLSTVCIGVTDNHDFWTACGSTDRYADGGWLRILRGKGNFVGVDGDVVEYCGLRICCNGWLQIACSWPPLDPTSFILVPGYTENAEIPCHWVIDTDTMIATHSSGERVTCRTLST